MFKGDIPGDEIEIEYPSSASGDIGSLLSSSDSPSEPSSASSSKGKKPVIITKDEDYFMESAFMVFQVEQCLFRVPTYLFSKESHVFGGMFHLPRGQPSTESDAANLEGYSESNPIIFPDEFKKQDFKCLLKALYPLSFSLHLSLPKDEWISILKLSTKWYFLNLRTTAISELERDTPSQPGGSLTSLEKITLGREYRISSWLLTGLVDLVMREETINDDEALDIDSSYPTTAYRLYRTRERRIRGSFNPRGNKTTMVQVQEEVKSLFKEEFDQVKSDEKAYAIPEDEIAFEVTPAFEPEPAKPEPIFEPPQFEPQPAPQPEPQPAPVTDWTLFNATADPLISPSEPSYNRKVKGGKSRPVNSALWN